MGFDTIPVSFRRQSNLTFKANRNAHIGKPKSIEMAQFRAKMTSKIIRVITLYSAILENL